jgi:hypothetical protein
MLVRGGLHETQDRGDFCGRYCRLQPTGCRDEEETPKVTGFFKAAGSTMISPDARGDVARRMADAQSGWNAVAVGTAGRPDWD